MQPFHFEKMGLLGRKEVDQWIFLFYFTFLSAISLQEEEVRSWELGRSLLAVGTGKILWLGDANVAVT